MHGTNRSEVNTREESIGHHTCKSCKRSKGVKLNGIIECELLSKKEHRTSPTAGGVPAGEVNPTAAPAAAPAAPAL
jgi:hypothetical protein